jgi:glycine/D-amino acid oxidase-like deaminating enzyme
MTHVYIIGAGLFGSVARDLLASHGIPCTTIDAGEPLAGSRAAGCLTKPSWLNGLGTGRKIGLDTLDKLYGLKSMPLRVGPLKLETIFHVPPSKILRGADIQGWVTSLNPDTGEAILHSEDGNHLHLQGRLLVAAGIWSQALLPGLNLSGLQGASLRIPGRIPEARLKVWAPFKQTVAFNIGLDTVWCGDGTAVKRENWAQSYLDRVVDHARDVCPELDMSLVKARTGIRPYAKGQVGLYKQVGKNCWVSSGGAKNGVVLAALQATYFLNDIEKEL